MSEVVQIPTPTPVEPTPKPTAPAPAPPALTTQTKPTEIVQTQTPNNFTEKNPKWNKFSLLAMIMLIMYFFDFKLIFLLNDISRNQTYENLLNAHSLLRSVAIVIHIPTILLFIIPFLVVLFSTISLFQIRKTKENGKYLSICTIIIGSLLSMLMLIILAMGLSGGSGI